MTFREDIKEAMKGSKCKDSTSVEAKSGGSGAECGPSMHRHPDVYQNKCHSIYQKHTRKQVGPNKSPNSQIKKTVKRLKVD